MRQRLDHGGAEGGEDRDVPTEAGRCCCAGFSWRCRRLGAELFAGWTWPQCPRDADADLDQRCQPGHCQFPQQLTRAPGHRQLAIYLGAPGTAIGKVMAPQGPNVKLK